jgi:hypothetical protein
MSEAVWYWWEGNTQHGPVTWDKLKSLAESGKVSPSDWVMREGWPDRKLACEANDSNVDMAAVGPPPAPPPLPLPPLPPATALAPPDAAAPVAATSFGVPLTLAPVTEVGSAALMPLPLPPLAPEQTLLDPTATTTPADGTNEGDVLELRRALRDERQAPKEPGRQWNLPAIVALAASVTGLMFLAFEMGVVGLGLGGWCLYASSASGNTSGKNLAVAAVVIGGFNVAFRVLCATVDLGLVM